MKLYGSYTSPYVRHCRIVLAQTNTAFEFIETDRAASAQKSPTQRVPLLEDGKTTLTDSVSIVRYLRQQAGQTFLESAQEFDTFCLVNTALDACANVFFLELDGITNEQSPYLQRQADRIQSVLNELSGRALPTRFDNNDLGLKLACFLDWANYRNRVDLTVYPILHEFLQTANRYHEFTQTAPPSIN